MTYAQIRKEHKLHPGFTLIEIMIAITIIGILGAILAPSMLSYLSSSKETATKSNLRTTEMVINQFYADTGSFPEKLRDLIKKPADEQAAKKWKGPYLKSNSVPTDGWDTPFVYKKPGEKGHPYELYSYGPNGKGAPKNEWISVWDL
jgi:general secretion pathway protein G